MSLLPAPRLDILGVPVACLSRQDLLRTGCAWARQAERRTVCYANAHTLNLASQDTGLRAVLNQADLVYADGVSVVWAARFLYNKPLEKLTARAWIEDFAVQAGRQELRLFLFGGRPGVAPRAAERLAGMAPGLQIVGMEAGIFSMEQEDAIVQRINAARPELLMVGLGTPLQEKWLARHRQALLVPLCWAVGALFDTLAGGERPVPPGWERSGLEWLWRLFQDPCGKWQRYLVGNPLFIWQVWRQKRNLR